MKRILTLFALLAATGVSATAQDYPVNPVRFIVPFAAGGPNDTVARLMAPKMAELLGQPVVVENRAGAGGVVGTDAVAKADPDGYVIGISSAGALAISESIQPTMPYDRATDLLPITLVGTVPELLVVHPDTPAQDFEELISWARENPGALNYASSGPGGMQHLAGEMLNLETGIDALHVPYQGAAPAVVDLLGGQVEMMFADLPVLLTHVESGALRPIVVGSQERSPSLPDVPTTAELGYPEVVAENWYGVVAPAGLPDDIARRLSEVLIETLNDAQVAEAMRQQGVNVVASTSEEFGQYMTQEAEKWAEVIERSGAVVQ